MKYLLIIFALIASGCTDNTQDFLLEATPGYYSDKDIGAHSITHSIDAVLDFKEYYNDNNWPPAAYLGFYQGESKDNSVQFVIIRNKSTDNYFVAGYRLVENGKIIKVTAIKNIETGKQAKVKISISNGLASIELEGEKPVKIYTNLKQVKPYASVSSCIAHFKLSPDI